MRRNEKPSRDRNHMGICIKDFPRPLREDLKAIAVIKGYPTTNCGVTVNQFMIDILQQYVDAYKKKRGGITPPSPE